MITLFSWLIAVHLVVVDEPGHLAYITPALLERPAAYTFQPIESGDIATALDKACQGNEEVVLLAYSLPSRYPGIMEALGRCMAKGKVVYVCAGNSDYWHTIIDYQPISQIVSAVDENGNQVTSVYQGPEVELWANGCYGDECSTSVATTRAAVAHAATLESE